MNDINSSQGSPFLPKGFKEFFKSRFNELIGLLIITFVSSVIIAIWSFNPNDPIYYFKSSTIKPLNILGIYGSNISGILLHLFGTGSIFFCVFGYFWGFKFLRNEEINKKRIKAILLFPSIILLSIFLSFFDYKAIFLPEGVGGALGHMIASLMPLLNDNWAFGYLSGGNWPFLTLCLLIGFTIFLWCCTASKKEIGIIKIIIFPIIKIFNYLILFLFRSLKQNKTKSQLFKKSKRIEPTIGNKRKGLNSIRSIDKKKPRQTSLTLKALMVTIYRQLNFYILL